MLVCNNHLVHLRQLVTFIVLNIFFHLMHGVKIIHFVLVLYAMQTAPLSLVAPAREVSMLFAALIGGHLLGEGDRGLRVLGALLIAGGVTMLGIA